MYTYTPCLLTSVFLLCSLSPNASGEVLFNNFGPNDGYNGSSGAGINWWVESPGSSANMGLGAAARFEVSGGSYSLSSVTLALGNIYPPGNNNLAISIFADNNGMPAGGLLETVVMHPTDLTSDYLVVSYPSSLNPVMVGGNYYWVVVEAADLNQVNGNDNAAFSWYSSGTLGYKGSRYFNFTANDWNNWQVWPDTLVPAFRIEGTPIPEPSASSMWLVGAGLIALARRSKSRRRN